MKTKINALFITLSTILVVNCDVPSDELVESTQSPLDDESDVSSLLSPSASDLNDESVELDKTIVEAADDAASGRTRLRAEQSNEDRERTLIGTLKMLSGTWQGAGGPRIPGFPPLVMCLWGDCEPQSPRPRPSVHYPTCSAKCFFSSCSGSGTCACDWGSAECGPKLAAAPSSSAEQRKNLEWFIALSESAEARDLAENARELREALALGDGAAIMEAAEALECEAEALLAAP